MDDLFWYTVGVWIGGCLVGIFIGANEQRETPGQFAGIWSMIIGIPVSLMAVIGLVELFDGLAS